MNPSSSSQDISSAGYTVSIHYCPGCKWLARSAWMAQELLETFGSQLSQVSLCPADKSGTFVIYCQQQVIWERERDSGFPAIKELKRRVRDVIAPQADLGHIDR